MTSQKNPPMAMIKLRVQPNASRNEIVGPYRDAIKVKIQAPALHGAANGECLRLLARRLGIAKKNVWIEHGAKSSDKVIGIASMTEYEAKSRLLKGSKTPG